MAKSSMDAAIARGQGRSMDGSALHALTYEFMMPPSVALVLDIQTDNPRRTLHEVNDIVKRHEGTQSTTNYLFSRLGRVVFAKSGKATLDDIMDDAIDAGAEDLEETDDGSLVVWTQPKQTNEVVKAVGAKFNLNVSSADILWSPNEDTMAPVGDSLELQKLVKVVSALKGRIDVQSVYSNAARGEAAEEDWEDLEKNLDV